MKPQTAERLQRGQVLPARRRANLAASRLTGRRAWIIPAVALAFVLMRVYFLQRLLDSLIFTLLGLLARLGIIPLP